MDGHELVTHEKSRGNLFTLAEMAADGVIPLVFFW